MKVGGRVRGAETDIARIFDIKRRSPSACLNGKDQIRTTATDITTRTAIVEPDIVLAAVGRGIGLDLPVICGEGPGRSIAEFDTGVILHQQYRAVTKSDRGVAVAADAQAAAHDSA